MFFRLLVLVSCFLLCSGAFAEEVATIYSLQGEVQVSEGNGWLGAAKGQELSSNQVVRTSVDGRCALLFKTGYLMRLNPNSTLALQGTDRSLSLQGGKAYFFSRETREFPTLETPVFAAGIRGTEFGIEVTDTSTKLVLLDGAVRCFNQFGETVLRPGELCQATLGHAPAKSIVVNPLDAVQWALRYPSPDELVISSKLRKSALLLSRGEVKDAQANIDWLIRNKETEGEARALKALILLVKNRRSEARAILGPQNEQNNPSVTLLLVRSFLAQADKDLDLALKLMEHAIRISPNSPYLLSRKSELLMGFGDVEEAYLLAKQAVDLPGAGAYSLSVHGFAALMLLQTDQAKRIFNQAIELDSGGGVAYLGYGLALAREGDLGGAVTAFKKATLLEPSVSLYRSYLGKAFFESENEQLSLREYDRAIALDSRDPTPHLYRAFSNLSLNKPIAALGDIETSIELNNNRGVYRSGLLLDQDLGVKASSLAQVFERLGFHDAARLEAIKSIGRDYSNPAPHLLLSDSNRGGGLNQAALSESLVGRLLLPVNYNSILPSSSGDLSFNEFTALFDRPVFRTEIETAYVSEIDRFSAAASNIYSDGVWGYGIRLSEDLEDGKDDDDLDRSRSLTTSIQRQLGFNSNLILDSTLTAREEELSDSDAGSEVDSGQVGLGFHYRFGPGSHLITQLRYDDTDEDQNSYLFNPNRIINVLPNEDAIPIAEKQVVAIGDTTAEYSGTRFDVQYIFDSNLVSFVVGGGVLDADVSRTENSVVNSQLNMQDQIGGSGPKMGMAPPPGNGKPPGGGKPPKGNDKPKPGGSKPSNKKPPAPKATPAPTPVPPPEINLIGSELASSSDSPERSQRAFLYTSWHVAEWMDLDLGGALQRITLNDSGQSPPYIDGSHEESEFLPKVGLLITPTANTTIRTAYFETLGVAGFTDITKIEPTVVGGFNQTFDSFPGALAEGWGIGLDHKFPKSAYFGSEFQHREFDEQNPSIVTNGILQPDGTISITRLDTNFLDRTTEEDRVRSYWYQVISDELASTVEHIWSSRDTLFTAQKRNEEFSTTLADSSIEEQQVRFNLRAFHPSGWYGFTRASWNMQDLGGISEDLDGKHDYWLFDVGIGYQLAHRQGALQFDVSNLFGEEIAYTSSSQQAAQSGDPLLALRFRYNF